MDVLAALQVFVRVAETGSFSAVARERGVSQPAISRQLSALEEHLGARLVQRTTRSVGLTEEGRDFLGPAQSALLSVEAAEAAVGRRHVGIGGLVRIATSVVFGRVMVAPSIHLLLERYPALQVDLVTDDPARDLVQDGVDLAIRVGAQLGDQSFVVRRLGQYSELVVGAPAYLGRHGIPLEPAELAGHHCILDDRAPERGIWHLQRQGGAVDVAVSGRFRTDSSDAKREAALAGLGLATLSPWVIRAELEQGTLQQVLPAWRCAPVPIHAIYPSRRNLAPRLRVVLDFMLEQVGADTGRNRLV